MFSPSSSARSNTLKLTGQYTGEYQPATSSAPAQNVPKPLKTVPPP